MQFQSELRNDLKLNKRTEYEPSQFGSSREHIAAANAASKGPLTVFVWVLNVFIYCSLE